MFVVEATPETIFGIVTGGCVHSEGSELDMLNDAGAQYALLLFVTFTLYFKVNPGYAHCVEGDMLTVGFVLVHDGGTKAMFMVVLVESALRVVICIPFIG